MLTYEQIEKLLDAGYSKEEINKLFVDSAIGSNAETEENPNETNAESEENSNNANEDAQIQISNLIENIAKSVDEQITKLKKAYEEYNIAAANNKIDLAQGVDDIIAEIVNPTFKKEKGE